MSDLGVDFIPQYRNISNKLKKRFLRKTNAAEPSDQFALLAVQCEKSDLPEYAGISWLGVASCEASLGHSNEESTAWANAGRQFLNAEKKTLSGCEQLSKMSDWCCKQSEKNSTFSVEKHFSEPPLLMYQNSPHHLLLAKQSLAQHCLYKGDYEGALNLFTEIVSLINSIVSSPFGIYKDLLYDCEIYRVLLVLVLGPTPQRLPPDLPKLLDKYTWIGEPDEYTKSLVGEELFFLLQSLVMGCQSQDSEAVTVLQEDLSSHLNKDQMQLVLTILRESQ